MRRRRQAQRLSQADLGGMIGCSQAAISQFESGHTSAISRENQDVLFQQLGIDAKGRPDGMPGDTGTRLMCCNRAGCPMNRPYLLGEGMQFQPLFLPVPIGEQRFCTGCGDPMIERCPNSRCQAPFAPGSAFCHACGTPIIPLPEEYKGIPDPKRLVDSLTPAHDAFLDAQEIQLPTNPSALPAARRSRRAGNPT